MKAAATTFRENSDIDVEKVITQLGVGEALVSVLDAKGVPTVVQQTKIWPPESRMGPANLLERKDVYKCSPIDDIYDESIDRKSVEEILKTRAEAKIADVKEVKKERQYQAKKSRQSQTTCKSRSRLESTTQTVIKSATKIATSRLGQSIIRGIMGSIFKGR